MQKNNLSAGYWVAHRIDQKAENQAWKTSKNQRGHSQGHSEGVVCLGHCCQPLWVSLQIQVLGRTVSIPIAKPGSRVLCQAPNNHIW